MNRTTERWAAAPELLATTAADLWPNISVCPTGDAVENLLQARRSRPDDYLSVLAGLRWHASSDVSSAWSFLAAWLAVIAIFSAALSGPFGVWALWISASISVAFTVLLIRVSALVVDQQSRKRHATVWIAALEDAHTIRGRAHWWRRPPG